MYMWVLKGLKTGVVTTRYPEGDEAAPGITSGLPRSGDVMKNATSAASRCPTWALTLRDKVISVDVRRCVHCFRCRHDDQESVPWKSDYEWAVPGEATPAMRARPGKAFIRSLHIRVVDAGACGACLTYL